MSDKVHPGVISKDLDLNAVDNAIFVQLSNGTSALSVTGGILDVTISNSTIAVTQSGTWTIDSITNDVSIDDGGNSITIDDGGLAITVDGTVAVSSVGGTVTVQATNLDIRDIDNATDDILVYGWDGTSNQKIKTDSAGELQVDVLTLPALTFDTTYVDDSAFVVATDKLGAIGMLADETSPDSVGEGDIGIPRMTLDRKQLNVIVDATTDSQRLAINASGEAQVDVASHGLTNSNALPISKDNNANSETNPIFTQVVNTAVSGTEVHDYDTVVNAVKDTPSNHDYTVTGTTFLLKQVILSASGNARFEIQVGALASLVTKAVIFLNGREGDTREITFSVPIEIPVTSTGTVRIVRTNKENQDQDLYSTIVGSDV